MRIGQPIALLALSIAMPFQIQAQSFERVNLDDNGIDVVNGSIKWRVTDLSIGADENHGMTFNRRVGATIGDSNLEYTLYATTSSVMIYYMGNTRTFSLSGSGYVANSGEGESLVYNGSTYIYTMPDGTSVTFAKITPDTAPTATMAQYVGQVSSVSFPDGTKWIYHYNPYTYTYNGKSFTKFFVRSVTNNFGYQIRFDYLVADAGRVYMTSAKAINMAVEACDPDAAACYTTHTWPTVSYSWKIDTDYTPGLLRVIDTVTDVKGVTWVHTYYGKVNDPRIASVSIQGAAAPKVKITYTAESIGSPGLPNIVTVDGKTSVYGFSLSGDTRTTSITDGLGHTRYIQSSRSKQAVIADQDENGWLTSYTYDAYGRLSVVTYPERNSIAYEYDNGVAGGRGNVRLRHTTPMVRCRSSCNRRAILAHVPAR